MTAAIRFRTVLAADATTLRRIAQACPPLDVHTHYTYWVIAAQYGDISTIIEDQGEAVGMVTMLLRDERAFCWQIGILPKYRGTGIISQALDQTISRLRGVGAKALSVSISADNSLSLRVFENLADRVGSKLNPIGEVDLVDQAENFFEHETLYEIPLTPPIPGS